MSVSPGSRLGSYEIVGKLGSGGMADGVDLGMQVVHARAATRRVRPRRDKPGTK
jgi:hypothetical protein